MNLPKLKVSMPAFIVVVLLLYFGLALFGKRLGIEISGNDPLVQTLINLTIAAASYFIGTSQGSAKKDDQAAALTAQIVAAPVPPAPTTPPAEPAPSFPPLP